MSTDISSKATKMAEESKSQNTVSSSVMEDFQEKINQLTKMNVDIKK
jgi:hypothetical protein